MFIEASIDEFSLMTIISNEIYKKTRMSADILSVKYDDRRGSYKFTYDLIDDNSYNGEVMVGFASFKCFLDHRSKTDVDVKKFEIKIDF